MIRSLDKEYEDTCNYVTVFEMQNITQISPNNSILPITSSASSKSSVIREKDVLDPNSLVEEDEDGFRYIIYQDE